MNTQAFPCHHFEIEKRSAGLSIFVWIVYLNSSRLAYFWDPQSAVEFVDAQVEV